MWTGVDEEEWKFRLGSSDTYLRWDGESLTLRGTLTIEDGSGNVLLSSGSGVPWDKISGVGKPENGATVGAPAGTLVAGVPAANVATAVTDFNASNNRNSAAIAAPAIATDGTAVEHVAQKDGSVDISFEWAWDGNEGDIDGFLVFVRQSASATAYTFGTTPAEETVYTVPANKRAFVLFGVAADKYYTFGVQAYRAVDKVVNAAGVIKSTLVKATGSGENPYRPSTSVEFSGDVTGTIDGTLASTLVTNASTALTRASAAQADATKALNELAGIAADNKLTPAEKKSVRKEWDTIYAERAGIRAQADSFGITTEKTNYDNDFQALGTYLNGGTAYTIGATPPSWITDENLAVTTTIVGTTFRANWSNLYADRQALLNKISAEAAKRADWSNVSGAGRPEDYAATNDANILPDGNFVKQATGQGSYWTLTSGASITSTQGENSTAGLRLNANGQYQYATQNNFIPARAGDVFFVRARVFVASESDGAHVIQMTCHDGNKGELPSYPNAGNIRTSVTNGSWQTFEGKITISHAGTQYVRVRPLFDLAATAGYLIISDLWVSRTIATQITPSNVSTYIASAAIGNAQIGGDIWSSNYVYNSSGWYLQRNGNLYCANAFVRGDVEASSLKANTAMVDRANIVNAAVDTLQIAGNAVTIPVSASGTTSCQTASTSFEDAPVAVVMAVVAQLSMRGTNTLGTQIIAYASLYRGNSLIKQIEINNATYSPDSTVSVIATGTWVLSDTPGSSSTYYQVVLSTLGGDSSVLSTSSCSLLAIGVKR
jgi:hypothetical protein